MFCRFLWLFLSVMSDELDEAVLPDDEGKNQGCCLVGDSDADDVDRDDKEEQPEELVDEAEFLFGWHRWRWGTDEAIVDEVEAVVADTA